MLAINPGDDLRIEEAGEYEVRDICTVVKFRTWRLMRGKRILMSNRAGLPRRNGASKIQTREARGLMLHRLSTDTSCRATADTLNRIAPETPISHITLRNSCEREGLSIDTAIDKAVEEVGPIPTLAEKEREIKEVPQAEVEMLTRLHVPEALQKEALANPVVITPADATVNLSTDGVMCKKQIESRGPIERDAEGNRVSKPKLKRAERKKLKEERGERKTVSTACGTFIAPGQRKVTLAARTYKSLFIRLIALLYAQRLQGLCVCLFSDGERAIREDALTVMNGKVRGFQQILDWYHLYKKIGEMLSPALKNIELRREQWTAVSGLLWHGAVDSAIAHLRALPPEFVRNPRKIEGLIDYLQARRAQIPVYSVRKALGLPNSSNPAEKACDLLVSRRQKRQGMAWSADGSYAFAVIRATIVSGQLNDWLNSSRFVLHGSGLHAESV